QLVDGELGHVLGVALDEPLEAVVAAEHPRAVVARLDGRRRDDRVDAGGGTAADEDRQRLHGPYCSGYRRAGAIGGWPETRCDPAPFLMTLRIPPDRAARLTRSGRSSRTAGPRR